MEDLQLTGVEEGTRMRLRVSPGSRSNRIMGVHGGALKVSVSAPPERGKANRAVVDLLADVLGLPRSSVRIVAGESSRDKVALLPLPPEKVRDSLS